MQGGALGLRGGVTYRADIDGLRAVAVLAVFAFHAEVGAAPGGFVGVDVFFVISGYLITGILVREMAAGTFSLVRFYERRVRRILPALFFVLGCCAVAGWLWLLPPRLADMGQAMAASALSAGNVLFWLRGGYFDERLRSEVLLHTWSLGVEEQFYLVWPLVLWAVHRRWPRMVAPVVVAVIAGSFAAAVGLVARDLDAAFYLLPARAWELALGGAVACGVVRLPWAQGAGGRWVREGAAALGLGMIGLTVTGLHGGMALAGAGMLVPCGGAVLVILAGMEGGRTVVGRVLSAAPAVMVGRISFSLYLWHWPLLVARNGHGLTLGGGSRLDTLAVMAVSLGLAWLTWRFVEQPFRVGRVLAGRRLAFGGAAVGTVAAVAVGVGLAASDGAPGRFAPDVVATAATTGYVPPEQDCFIQATEWAAPYDTARCLRIEPRRRNVALLGDSHAGHLLPGLAEAMPGVNVILAAGAACRPLLGAGPGPAGGCAAMRAEVFGAWLPRVRLDGVILASAWQLGDEAALGATVAALVRQGHAVTVLGPIVRYRAALPDLLANGMVRGDPGLAGGSRRRDHEAMDGPLRAAVEAAGGRYVSLLALLCGEGGCVERADDGLPLQYDRSHLTASGSRAVARRLVAAGALPWGGAGQGE